MTGIGVFYGKGFDTLKAKRTPISQLSEARLYAEGKPVNLLPEGGSTLTYLSVQLPGSGIGLITAKKEVKITEIEREDLIRQFSGEGFTDLSEKIADKDEFDINNIFEAKTLLMASRSGGNYYSEKAGQELELTLSQNPYKLHYGEDIAVQVLFRGKPLAKVHTEVYTKTLNGSIFVAEYLSDEEGKVYVKLNRSGEWMIRAVHILPADQGIDYNRWSSSYSFGFR